MKYPKIDSLYKRDGVTKNPDGTFTFDKQKTHRLKIGEHSNDEYALIKRWQVFEKIDGTNIRIIYEKEGQVETVTIKGRTDESDIPGPLKVYLYETFTIEKMAKTFPEASRVILFGEGYGPKIQSGGSYRKDVSFILFDTMVQGWWLKYSDRLEVCSKLGIDHVPMIGEMSEESIVAYVACKPKSFISLDRDFTMEGVVCVTNPLLRDRKGDILRFKLRCEDFEDAVRQMQKEERTYV